MNYEKKSLIGSRMQLDVVLSAEEFDKFVSEARRRVSENLKIKGFRPGKAPEGFVAENDHLILEEAANLAMNKCYAEILDKEEIEPVGRTEAELLKLAVKNDFSFRLIFDVLPRPEMPDYKKIAVDVFKNAKISEISEKEEKEALEWLKKSRAILTPKEEAAESGDFVALSVSALSGEEVLEKDVSERFVLGEGQFLPGFEKEIIGLKKNDTKSFELDVPKDYWRESLRDKKISFSIIVESVAKVELPEENDDWAKSLGDFNNLESLKKSIKDGLLAEKERKERERLRSEVLKKISEKVTLELPTSMVEKEMEHLFSGFKKTAEDSGLSLDDYLKKMNKTEEEIKNSFNDDAKENLKAAIIIREIGRRENCEPENEEIEKTVNEFLSKYQDKKEAESKIDTGNLFAYTKEKLFNEAVFLFLEKAGGWKS